MIDDDVLPYVRERLPSFSPTGKPVRLPGGNLNRVWRVPGAERSVIVKHAPPYVAANPDVPLDPSRLLIEARCLKALHPEGQLGEIAGPHVRPPQPIDVNPDDHVLLMEDLGDAPPLDQWLREAEGRCRDSESVKRGRWLGRFIGRLHARTLGDASVADAFDNRPMQETRLAVQYRGVTDMLKAGGVDDAEVLGERAESLGVALPEPGRCLTMGDLWPPSVLVVEEGLRLIDWELAHYGRPLQDVAHWLAHLWMQEHRAPSPAVAEAVDTLRRSFLYAYGEALRESKRDLWTADEKRDVAVHFGAEILVRAVGPFQEGYVYDGLEPEHPAVQEAVRTAVHHLRSPEDVGFLRS